MKKLITVLLAVCVLGLIPPALAQQSDGIPVICGDLAEADCDILTESYRKMASVTSARYTMEFEMGVRNLPDDEEDVTFGFRMDGAYEGDWSVMASNLTPTALVAIMTSSQSIETFVTETLREYRQTLTITMIVPEEVAAEEDIPTSIAFDTILVDGVFYIDMDTLLTQIDPEAEMPGWVGFDLARMMGRWARLAAGQDPADEMPDMESAAFANEFVSVTRLPDEMAEDGTAYAVFDMSFDTASMLRAPEMVELAIESMRVADPEAEAGARDFVTTMLQFVAAMADGFEAHITLNIDSNELYLRETSFAMDYDTSVLANGFLNLMAGGFATLVGEDKVTFEVAEIDSVVFTMQGTVKLEGFDEPQDIRLPEGAQVTTIKEIMENLRDQMPTP